MRVTGQRLATAEETFYVTLQDDEIRASVPRLNEAISKMLTLATALAGGSLVFLKEDVCVPWARVAAAALFFVALGVAAFGLIPARGWYSQDIDRIREQRQGAVNHKRFLLKVVCGVIAGGLFVAILGAAIKVWG